MTIKELNDKLKELDEHFEARFVDKNGTEIVKQGEDLFLQSKHKGDIQIYFHEQKIITITDKYDINTVEVEEGIIDINAMKLYIEMLQVASEYIKDSEE